MAWLSLRPLGTVEAEVKKVFGSFMGAFGIAFRLQDKNNFFPLAIDVHGYYAVYSLTGGYGTPIVNWSYSAALNTGYDSTNTLKVTYTNSTTAFSVFISGIPITTFINTTFSGGYYGYFVDVMSPAYERFPNHPGDVRFKSRRESGITVEPTEGLVTTEAGATASFTVVLNGQPSAEVTIGLWNSDETEGAVGPASLTFTSENWSVPQTVTVTGVDDLEDDETRLYTIATLPQR